ncbi:hypothetical protein ACH5RR_011262 [Cinchona calisaya]|uniref:Uncharacterized protein n=1 Tax=Cinchona calisaya TaxID=153742 RepID=A0ABD3A4F4_9GENT
MLGHATIMPCTDNATTMKRCIDNTTMSLANNIRDMLRALMDYLSFVGTETKLDTTQRISAYTSSPSTAFEVPSQNPIIKVQTRLRTTGEITWMYFNFKIQA